ncbi:hypothetical protein O0I10_008618 [Lichtheimia ornata]|uniref:D-serine dehydratase n=1 Tax=Lichtheimia ornata TaxID=688661 RepID=A0AAD7XWQ0_9FUNG|nr:uncharacterized protein O0I10_008618 [Lichtheimia ornata]KAJ8655733.1 hypothetical protein O0I10_008618 [Lichtheimia ornata]
MMTTPQTFSPLLSFWPTVQQEQKKLRDNLVGKRLNELRTPSLVLDRSILERNCQRLASVPSPVKVRVHVKSHKTLELTEMQLAAAKTDAVVVSTLAEAHFLASSHLVAQNKIKQLLLGFPISPDKFAEVFQLAEKVERFQVFIDQLGTLDALDQYHAATYGPQDTSYKIDVFIKVDCGYGRAGVPLKSNFVKDDVLELAKRLSTSSYATLFGLYTHAGHSYNARSPEEAFEYLEKECESAREFRDYFIKEAGVDIPYLSIGATPTVGAVIHHGERAKKVLEGISEVHAGAYTLFDRQQAATGLCTLEDVAITVLARVTSLYPDRGTVLIDGGALAFSKDVCPQGGFGVLQSNHDIVLRSVSQEHGILQADSKSGLELGQVVRVIPNHCCLTSACHMYYLIIEGGGDTVVDVWFPVRGW